MTIEAMKQALEWAYNHGEIVFVGGGMKAVDGMNAWARSVSQAIEQDEKPFYKIEGPLHVVCQCDKCKAEKQEPVQEPVYKVTVVDDQNPAGVPLSQWGNTPAAQRQWVGLTQEDIDIAFDDTQEGGGFNEFARAIEQTLRRKNK
jgi:hypothetical protein